MGRPAFKTTVNCNHYGGTIIGTYKGKAVREKTQPSGAIIIPLQYVFNIVIVAYFNDL